MFRQRKSKKKERNYINDFIEAQDRQFDPTLRPNERIWAPDIRWPLVNGIFMVIISVGVMILFNYGTRNTDFGEGSGIERVITIFLLNTPMLLFTIVGIRYIQKHFKMKKQKRIRRANKHHK